MIIISGNNGRNKITQNSILGACKRFNKTVSVTEILDMYVTIKNSIFHEHFNSSEDIT